MPALPSFVPRGRRAAMALGYVAALVVVVLVVARVSGGDEGSDGGELRPGEPNIVVVMTDDQTLALLSAVPKTRASIVDQGTLFSLALTSFPNCCPSRATYLSGQYAHNHGVRDNVAPHGGWTRFDASTALPVALQGAGYDTIHIGKYLNGWGALGDISPPPGWTRWFGLVDPTTYRYDGYTVSVDGTAREYGTAPADYQTDVLAAEAVAQIEARAGGDRPFFLSFTPLAPHAEGREVATAAPSARRFPLPAAPERYADLPADGLALRTEAYDEADVSDKPQDIADRPPLSRESEGYLADYLQAERGALAAVDDAVESIISALDRTGVLDETVVVFTSDNGLFHGEHRVVSGKFLLYEPAVRVPLAIRGPGFPVGEVVTTPVGNADLAPTIAEIADAELATTPDGASLLDRLDDDGDADRAVLLENYSAGELNTAGVRTRRWAYVAHTNRERELYDLIADPSQLENRAGAPELAEVEEALAALLGQLQGCEGTACEVEVPEVAR